MAEFGSMTDSHICPTCGQPIWRVSAKQQLGLNIRKVRKDKNLSQADLGTLLTPFRSHAAVSDIERGKTGLDLDDIIMVAKALGLTCVSPLLNGIDRTAESKEA